MIDKLRDMGVKSSHLYTAGFASIGVAVASWTLSTTMGRGGVGRADHWGIFIGQWAPTCFALGCALRMEEIFDMEHPEQRRVKERMAERGREPAGV
ncbi:hypothetical protein ABT294_41580 [Nonomuraea sp. NPDC000554]|uniref:hypothetical protein n=1 Tax=Nonomuraea sp. NPDC000554 TaxID=3154259 RepID=UPI00332AAA87